MLKTTACAELLLWVVWHAQTPLTAERGLVQVVSQSRSSSKIWRSNTSMYIAYGGGVVHHKAWAVDKSTISKTAS